jgi:PAS domain S-box-containing protein
MAPPDMPLASPPPRAAAVVVPDPELRETLCRLLRSLGIDPLDYANAVDALDAFAALRPPALVVTDLYMPELDGWRFCRLLRSADYPALHDVPLLVVSSAFSGVEPDRIASDLGVDGFWETPLDEPSFLAHAERLLHDACGTPRMPRALVVEPDPGLADRLVRAFVRHGYRADAAGSVRDAAAAFSAAAYDVAAIASRLHDGDGGALLDWFRSDRPVCACVMVADQALPGQPLDWMRRGAAAFLARPFEPDLLVEVCAKARRKRSLIRAEERLELRTRELRETQARLSSVLHTQRDIICRFKADTTLTYVNHAYERYVGRPAAELVGMPFLHLVPPEFHAAVRASLASLSPAAPSKTYEHAVRLADGSSGWVEWTDYALYDEHGALAEFQSVGHDVTERRRAEENLRRHNALLSAAAQVGRILLDAPSPQSCLDVVVALVGEASGQDRAYYFERIAENPPAPNAFRMRWEWVRPGIAPQIGNPMLQALPMDVDAPDAFARLAGGRDYFERVADVPAGQRKVLEDQGILSLLLVPVRVEGALEGFIGFDNCSDQRGWSLGERSALAVAAAAIGAGLRRQRMERRTEDAAAQLRLALAVARMGHWRYDCQTQAVEWFLGHDVLFGIPRERFAGDLDAVQECVHPDDREQGIRNLRHTLETGAPFDNTYRVVHPDGSVHWLHSYGHLSRAPDGRPLHVFGVTQDVTARKEAEDELQRQRDKLRELAEDLTRSEERQRRKIALRLHDGVGQLLNVAKMKLRAAEDAADSPGRARELAAIRQTLEQALADTRSLTGALSPPLLYDAGLVPALGWLVDHFQKDHPDVRFSFEGHAEPADMECRLLLFQIARELLYNVVKHAKARHAQVRLERDGKQIRLQVRDDGVGGIPSGSPFDSRVDDGFGLFSIRERIRLHGGSLDIVSPPGGGSAVAVAHCCRHEA